MPIVDSRTGEGVEESCDRQDAGPVEASLCIMDERSGEGSSPGSIRDRDADPDGWGVPEEVGIHGEEAGKAGLRAESPPGGRKWLDEDYPAIAIRAKREGAEIHWADETGIESDAYNARGYAPKGTTPVIHLNAKKNHIGMISSISNHSRVRFMMYSDAMHSDLLIIFMRRLIKDSGKKVFLILDNLRVHHNKKVTAWLEKHKKEIEVFFLPSYSPEFNPDEYLNGDLKGRIKSGLPARSGHTMCAITSDIHRLLTLHERFVCFVAGAIIILKA